MNTEERKPLTEEDPQPHYTNDCNQMHLVHIKHGLDKSNIGFTSDSVAVIAILIEVSKETGSNTGRDLGCLRAQRLFIHFPMLLLLCLRIGFK